MDISPGTIFGDMLLIPLSVHLYLTCKFCECTNSSLHAFICTESSLLSVLLFTCLSIWNGIRLRNNFHAAKDRQFTKISGGELWRTQLTHTGHGKLSGLCLCDLCSLVMFVEWMKVLCLWRCRFDKKIVNWELTLPSWGKGRWYAFSPRAGSGAVSK